MSKERLEEIKKKYFMYENYTGKVIMYHHVLEWLIQQAERVQELEEHAMKAIDNTEAVRAKLINAEEQNKRYREVLKNIYELAEYDEYDNTLEQIVSEVEKALEGDEK